MSETVFNVKMLLGVAERVSLYNCVKIVFTFYSGFEQLVYIVIMLDTA